MTLEIIGLGLEREQLTLRAVRDLTGGAQVILRTGCCAAAQFLAEKGVPFETLDSLYEQASDFDALAQALAQRVAAVPGDVIYGVLDIRDESVRQLCALRPDALIVPGVPLEGPLAAWALSPSQTFAASDLDAALIEAGVGTLVREITSFTLASEVKLALMTRYPEEMTVLLLQDGKVSPISLDELDRQDHYDHTTCVCVPACRELKRLERMGFEELKRITAILRGPDGCPWDRAQTHEGLRPYVVEEAWEVSDAIERGDDEALCEELGDLLWQVCMHADVAAQYGEFDMDDVTTGISSKMLRRHPHVFDSGDKNKVDEIWEEQKRREKGQRSDADAVRSVAKGLPALMRAQKVLGKLQKAGGVLPEGSEAAFSDERTLGALLLALCRTAHDRGLDAENALKKAVDALINDFSAAYDEKPL